MDPRQIAAEREHLAKAVASRYAERAKPRKEKWASIEKEGVFAAAGMAAAVRRTAHMSLAEGRAMVVAGPMPAAVPGRDRVLEAIVGPDDSDHVNFLPRGSMAARAVCRLVVEGQPVGTGFLVAPGVVLTNNHVIKSAEDAREFVAEFDYEFDCDGQLRQPIARFNLEPGRMFVTSDSDAGFDFTFVGVSAKSVDRRASIESFGWLPLDSRRDKILEGEPAVIIQHPRGEVKRLCLFASELVDRLESYIHYTTDTDPGSSGSPVLNRSWQVIGLHHASTTTGDRRRGAPVVVNEGVRASTIIAALGAGGTKATGHTAEVLAALTAPEVLADGRPQGPRLWPAMSAGVAPGRGRRPGEELSDGGGGNGIGRRLEATAIRAHDAAHFAGRPSASQGYKPNFLGTGRLSVALPRLPEALADDEAALTDGGTELKYTHFSVVCSASRRLPIVTAVNIDGAKSKSLAREDREFEAADVWFYDLRIPKAQQLPPQVYDRTAFDFGHQVRREDPVWGDMNTCRMANDDTFHMTNCAPQHHNLNTKTWLKLENAVLKAAKENRIKVSVFTGPVLSPRDPAVLDVPIPTAFWKIIAYADGTKLRAHGFIQDQTHLVEDVRSSLEALPQLQPASEYQVAIADIARVTSLDFGPLVDADELAGGLESLTGRGAGRARGPRRQRLDDSVIAAVVGGMPVSNAPVDSGTAAEDVGGDDEAPAAGPVADTSRVAGTNGNKQMAAIYRLLKDVQNRITRIEGRIPEATGEPPAH